MNRREVAQRTNNIQVRVGYQLPPDQGTHGETIIENNPKCGDLFVGPALDGGTTTIITCHGQTIITSKLKIVNFQHFNFILNGLRPDEGTICFTSKNY